MTTSKSSPSLSKALENLAEVRASVDPTLAPWHEAAKLLNQMKVTEAALKAAQGCGQNLMEDPMQGMILDEISNIAVTNGLSGAEIERMWVCAAEHGRQDLAYNAANEIMTRAKSVDEFKLAARYYKMAIQGSGPASLRASATANAAEILREGHITGKKDWLGAIALYEEAANMGLLQGMFNAGNVLLWLVEAGDKQYGDRAAAWFKKVIETVEGGISSVDIGGDQVREQVLRDARICLAQMHMDGKFKGSNPSEFDKLVSDYVNEPDVCAMINKYRYFSLVRATAKPGKDAAENWISVLKLLGWKVRTSILQDYGDFDGMRAIGTKLLIDTGDREALVMIVFHSFAVPGEALERVYGAIALMEEKRLESPVFYASNKGFFVQYQENAYSILQVAHKQQMDITPIWPGATILDVYATLLGSLEERFIPAHADPSNSIPRLVNALDEGIQLTGENLPNAIWLRAGTMFCMPIHRPEEPERIGLKSNSREYLKAALESNLRR